VEYAYVDIIDLAEQVPLGIMRDCRWEPAMVILVMLPVHVFMTGSVQTSA
jgi:hypothetical protein